MYDKESTIERGRRIARARISGQGTRVLPQSVTQPTLVYREAFISQTATQQRREHCGPTVTQQRHTPEHCEAFMDQTVTQQRHEHGEASSPRRWRLQALQCEVETLACINASREAELAVLKKRQDIPHDVIHTPVGYPQSCLNSPVVYTHISPHDTRYSVELLKSFATAPRSILEQVFGFMQKSLNTGDISQISPALAKLIHSSDKHRELVELVCLQLGHQTVGGTHNNAIRLINQYGLVYQPSLKNSIDKKNGIAWTVPPQ